MKFLDKARSLLGPLTPKHRELLSLYFSLTEPLPHHWEAIAGIIVLGRMRGGTVWSCVCAEDPSFPRTKPWNRIPSGFEVARAIKMALEKPKPTGK